MFLEIRLVQNSLVELSQTARDNLLIQANQLLESNHYQDDFEITEDYLIRYESHDAMTKLIALLQQSDLVPLSYQLKEFLAWRWKRIAGTRVEYTNAISHQVNQLCMSIAKQLSPWPINSSENKLSPYALLMPTLQRFVDVYGENINELTLSQFVMSDDRTGYIPINNVLSHACCTEDDNRFVDITTIDANPRPLSPSEIDRVRKHSPACGQLVTAVLDYQNSQKQGVGFVEKMNGFLVRFRQGGAKVNYGNEFNAGCNTNIAIAEFYSYWDALGIEAQRNIYQNYPGLKEYIDRIFRGGDTEFSNARYCIELIANDIGAILARYAPAYSATSLSQEAIQQLQRVVEEELSDNEHIPVSNTSQTMDSFLPELYRNSGKIDYWRFALHHSNPSVWLGFDINQGDVAARALVVEESLTLAIQHANLDAVKLLNRMGVQLTTHHFFCALQQGHVGIVAFFLANGFSYCSKINPLHVAIQYGHVELANFLIKDQYADLLALAPDSRNILTLAMQEKRELVPFVLSHISRLPVKKQHQFFNSGEIPEDVFSYAHKNQPQLLAQLIGQAVVENNTELLAALHHRAILDDLGETINCWQPTLHFAIAYSNFAVINALLDLGHDVNEPDSSGIPPLVQAIQSGRNDVVRLLIARKADYSTKIAALHGNTPLMIALDQPDHSIDIIYQLLRLDDDLDKKNHQDFSVGDMFFSNERTDLPNNRRLAFFRHFCNTPITRQCQVLRGFLGEPNLVNVLQYAIENYPDYVGDMIRCIAHHPDESPIQLDQSILEKLIDRENTQGIHAILLHRPSLVDVEIQGMPVLCFTSFIGATYMAQIFLEHKSDPNVQDSSGNTPLHMAVENNNIPLVHQLLNAQANIWQENHAGKTPYQLSSPEIRKIFYDHCINSKKKLPEDSPHRQDWVAYALCHPDTLQPYLRTQLQDHPEIIDEIENFLERINFTHHFSILYEKHNLLAAQAKKNSRYKEAATVARVLIEELVSAVNDIVTPQNGQLNLFKTSCQQAIQKALPVLSQHRGWKQVFVNFLIALTFPISLPLYCLGFFRVKTDSTEKLTNLALSLEKNNK